MKRYRPIRCNVNEIWYQKGMEEYEGGEWLNIEDCIIAQQDNMMLGDPVHGLWRQIQKQAMDTGPYDVMIIMKRREKEK